MVSFAAVPYKMTCKHESHAEKVGCNETIALRGREKMFGNNAKIWKKMRGKC